MLVGSPILACLPIDLPTYSSRFICQLNSLTHPGFLTLTHFLISFYYQFLLLRLSTLVYHICITHPSSLFPSWFCFLFIILIYYLFTLSFIYSLLYSLVPMHNPHCYFALSLLSVQSIVHSHILFFFPCSISFCSFSVCFYSLIRLILLCISPLMNGN